MKFGLIIITILWSSSLWSLPFLIPSDNNKISTINISKEKYTRLLKRSLRKTQKQIKKQQKHLSSDLKLEYVVIGLFLDIRKGLPGWSLGLGKASEFHYKVLRP